MKKKFTSKKYKMVSIGIILLIIIILFAIYRLTRRIYPQIHVNANGKVVPIISKMGSLKQPYRPTPWLIGTHMQTMYGMRFRKKHLNYRREIFTFDDKGQCALDFYEPIENVNLTKSGKSINDCQEFSSNPPILLIIHTLGGGTREPCSNNLAEAARLRGYRSLIYNNRGCSGVPFTSRRFYNASQDDDVKDVIHYLKAKYNPPQFFLVGFSLGAYMAALFDTDEGQILDGVALVSHSYDGNGSNEVLKTGFLNRKFYLPFMMQKVIHLFSKNHFIVDQYKDVMNAKTLDEYDMLYTCKEYGIKDVYEYYDEHSLKKRVPFFKAPTFVLGADNDPFTLKKYMPIKVIEQSEYCAFVHVAEGGHVSFPTGLRAEKSYIELVVLDFFDTIIKMQNSI